MNGLIVLRNSEGSIKHIDDAKIAVYGCPLNTQQSDTKITVVLKNAEDLKKYNKEEEDLVESIIKRIADSGVNVVIAG